MHPTTKYNAPDTAISYVLKGLTILDEIGVDRSSVLEDTGISAKELENRNGLISSDKIFLLIKNIEKKTGLQGTGLFFGSRLDITSHGMLGVATISQKNWVDAAKLLSSCCRSRYHSIFIEPYETKEKIGIRYRIEHKNPEYVIYIAELFSATLYRTLPYFIKDKSTKLKLAIHYQHDSPVYAPLYNHLFLTSPNFNQPFNEVMLDRQEVSTSLDNTCIETATTAKKLCTDDLLGTSNNTFRNQVLRIISANNTLMFSEIAQELKLGERTLRRKLLTEGTNFRKITEEKRNNDAKFHLVNSSDSISNISETLGFHDPASFCKTFKKINGVTPKMYRINITQASN